MIAEASLVLLVLDSAAVVENVLNDVTCASREFDSSDTSLHIDYLALLNDGCASMSSEPASENVSKDEILQWIAEFDSVYDFISDNVDPAQRGEGAVQGKVSPLAGDENLNREAVNMFGSFEVIDRRMRRMRKFRSDFVEILFYNRKEDVNYIGPIPDLQYYGVESLSKTAKKIMHDGHRDMVFYIKKLCINQVVSSV